MADDIRAARAASLKAAAAICRELAATFIKPKDPEHQDPRLGLVDMGLALDNWATLIETGWFVDRDRER